MMKQNILLSFRNSLGIFFCLFTAALMLADCSGTAPKNENDMLKATFLITCITIASIFAVLYISKKIKRKG